MTPVSKISALKTLWRLATCNHWNACRSLIFPDTTEINICTRCGRVLWVVDEGTRRHNPHKLRDQLRDKAPAFPERMEPHGR